MVTATGSHLQRFPRRFVLPMQLRGRHICAHALRAPRPPPRRWRPHAGAWHPAACRWGLSAHPQGPRLSAGAAACAKRHHGGKRQHDHHARRARRTGWHCLAGLPSQAATRSLRCALRACLGPISHPPPPACLPAPFLFTLKWTYDNLNDEAYLRRVVMPLEVRCHALGLKCGGVAPVGRL